MEKVFKGLRRVKPSSIVTAGVVTWIPTNLIMDYNREIVISPEDEVIRERRLGESLENLHSNLIGGKR